MINDSENFIDPSLWFIEGRFKEKVDVLAKGFLYKLFKNKTFFVKESVVYPFVPFKGHKKGFLLLMEEYVEIFQQSQISVVSLYYKLFTSSFRSIWNIWCYNWSRRLDNVSSNKML